MKRAQQARLELEDAALDIAAMRQLHYLDDTERHWRSFLGHLSVAWNKTIAQYVRSPKWGTWSAKYIALRKDDALLSYLQHARNSHGHSTREIVRRSDALVHLPSAKDVPGGIPDGSIIKVENLGKTIRISGAGAKHVRVDQAKTKLNPVVDRGVSYPIPTEHLGQPIDPEDLPALADLALRFYSDLLTDADTHFGIVSG